MKLFFRKNEAEPTIPNYRDAARELRNDEEITERDPETEFPNFHIVLEVISVNTSKSIEDLER